MRRFPLFFAILVLGAVLVTPVAVQADSAASSITDTPIPDPIHAPEDVVRIQLVALMKNDTPTVDAGIRKTWEFAHPQNKAITGPANRFGRMIKSPAYRHLIDHLSHDIQPLAAGTNIDAGRASFSVTIVTRENKLIGYTWDLERLVSGEYGGAWMTTGVSQPMSLGDSI